MKPIAILSLALFCLMDSNKQENKLENIASLIPAPDCLMAVTDELFMINFKKGVTVNSDESIYIFNEDGSVFEQIKLDVDTLVDSSPTRIIFDPKNDLEVGKTYYVNFSPNAFSDGTSITDHSTWSFTCGQKLQEVEMFSTGINENYRLLIGLPKNYDKNGNRTYPVIYITDGGFFNHNQYGEIADATAKGDIVDMITVGITYPDHYKINDIRKFRRRDLAFGNLYGFLKDTIIPYINSEYETEIGNNTLIGNSMGGLFAARTLTRYRENSGFPFKNIFSVAQLMDLTEQEAEMANEITDLPVNFFLGVGGADSEVGIKAYHTLVKNLSSRNYPSFKFRHKIYEGLPHGEVSSTVAFKEAFKWVFSR